MSKPKQTKIEMVRALLAQPKGASLVAICSATGWQPHSARAALSGLRKAGYTVERTATDEGTTDSAVYRIIATPGSAT